MPVSVHASVHSASLRHVAPATNLAIADLWELRLSVTSNDSEE